MVFDLLAWPCLCYAFMRLCVLSISIVRYGHFRKRKIFRLLRVFLSLIFNTLGWYLCSSKIILIDAEKVTLSFRMVSYRQYFAQHFCRHCSKILQRFLHYLLCHLLVQAIFRCLLWFLYLLKKKALTVAQNFRLVIMPCLVILLKCSFINFILILTRLFLCIWYFCQFQSKLSFKNLFLKTLLL